MAVIEVKNLIKEYQLGALTNIKDNALNLLKRMQGKTIEERERFKALDNISFNIEKGEVVGIIGTNGAGKSTLLKHLARITTPTSGSVSVSGTVAPLIEVGAGFVPDLTGRENIYLNCSIMGLSRKETKAKIDEIIEFSELEEFIDTPIKRYSSGMAVRLGFAVATSIDAEILIVDEVLAVGDLAFQRKCFDRMEELIKQRGKTVLLVSHNIRQVERICNRVIYLEAGKIIADGKSTTVCNEFYKKSDEKIDSATQSKYVGRYEKSNEISLLSTELVDKAGNPTKIIPHKGEATLIVRYRVNTELDSPVFGVGIHTNDFLYLATDHSNFKTSQGKMPPGNYTIHCLLDNFPFLPGTYSFRLGVAVGSMGSEAFYAENILHFQSVSTKITRAQNQNEGFVKLPVKWKIESSSD